MALTASMNCATVTTEISKFNENDIAPYINSAFKTVGVRAQIVEGNVWRDNERETENND
jgi:hypothetical protein